MNFSFLRIPMLFLLILIGAEVFSQVNFTPNFNNPNATHNGDGTNSNPIQTRDGSGTLGMTYNQTLCGLNFVQSSVMTTTRFSPPGTGLPVNLSIAGIPACAVIQQAYLYWIASTSTNDAAFTVNGTPGTGVLIGTGPDKCWQLGGTSHFRANVTTLVAGNGTYTVNLNTGASSTDGVTLIVIYTDPAATYRGTMILHDGCIVDVSGAAQSYNMTGIGACGVGSNVSAFLVTGDNQNNVTPPTHTVSAGAASAVFNNNFYNFDAVSPAVPSGLASLNYTTAPGGGDCYSIILAGLYFRTTTCGPCIPAGAVTLNMSQTPDNCSTCNGTASVAASGGSGTYTYTWSPAPAGGQGTATATGLCAGNYSVTVNDGGCVPTSGNVTVATTGVTPNTTITAAGPFCQNAAAVNLTAATAGGTWTGTGITNAATGTFNPATAGPGTHTITYTIGGPCGGNSTTSITVNALSTPTFTAIAPICSGGTITLPTTSTNTIAGTWAPVVNNTATTSYTFTPNAGQCANTTTMTVNVNSVPVMTTPANIAACPGDLVPASVFVSNPVGATFAWTNSNTAIGLGAGAAGNTPGFTATNGTGSAITGTITVTPTIGSCVGNPITYTITVNDFFDATISPVGPFCESAAAVNLTAVDAGGTWSGTGITNGATGTFNPSTAGVGTHTITYFIPGSCGSTDTENIIVNPDLDATITPAGPFCPADPAINLTAVDAGGTWTGTGITNGVNGTFDPSVAGSGTFTITYTIAGACGDVQTTSITVSNQLDATITPAGPFCASNGNAFLAAVDLGGTWSGNGIVNAATGEFSPSVAGAGNHIITYSIAGTCGDIQTTSIQVIADADATITAAGPFCVSDPALNLTAAQAGGVWSGTGITSNGLGTFNPATAGVGTHTITYTIAGVCGDNDQISIVVTALIPSTINAAGPFCVNANSVNLTAVNSGGTWSGNGITNAATGTFNPTTAGAGTHTITYTIGGGCGTSSTTSITVNPLPVPLFVADIASGCAPLAVNFANNSIPAGTNCIWAMSDGFIANSCGNVTNTFNNAGQYTVSLTITDANNCTATTTINNMINVFANPIADFTFGPTDATITNPIINFTNTSIGADLYNWDFGGLGTSTATNPTFIFPNTSPGNYSVCLTAETLNGCLDTACQITEIEDEFLVYVPNAFTPDNDGKNDEFKALVNGHDVNTFELLIFNRWGELIFQSEDPTTAWDGRHKGLDSPEDVYVWKIKVKQLSNRKLHEFIGHVSLLR